VLRKAFIMLLAVLVSLVGLTAPTLTAYAEGDTGNSAVTAQRDGVYLVKVYYETSNGEDYLLQYGSGFFVNEKDLLTCNHVVEITPEFGAEIQAYFGDNTYVDHIIYKVALMRDLEVQVEFVRASADTDFAIMRLQEEIAPPHALPLGNSGDVVQTEAVWTLGFPDVDIEWSNLTNLSFTADDVTVGSGTVSKLVDMDNTNFIQHNAPMSFGNSGGPLVDNAGIVVGINAQGIFTLGGDYNYSISIDQVKTALDKLAISYEPATPIPPITPTPGPDDPVEVDKSGLVADIADAEALAADLSGYTDETASALTNALATAKSVNGNESATQAQVDDARSALSAAKRGLVEKPSNMPLIIGAIVAAIAVIIIVIVIVVILKSRKKKKAVPPAPPLGAQPIAGPGMPPPPSAPNFGSPATTAPPSPTFPSAPAGGTTTVAAPVYQPPTPGFDTGGSGDTTVLNPAVGETSLLGGSQASATLLRLSNNERVRINRPDFTIGKERRKVNYVIPDNSAVSRAHARITLRGGQYFITDLNTTNFTFVNDKKIAANVETPLNKGDRIKLADEEFEFDV
jgi:S1-C subfamily serine protease